jgi:ABC-2 type transport system permease protein
MSDILTVIWKEWKELFTQGPRFRGGWIGMLVFIGVFGVLMPLQSGRGWVESPGTLLVWSWVPFLLVNSVVADSFAGERERHTLETLLASRLSDRAILFGKIGAAMVYGWGMTLLGLLLGLVTVNLAHGAGQLLLFPTPALLGILALSLLVAALSAGIGVLVSLRAATVRQAQQTLSVAFLVLFIPLFLLPLLPEAWRLTLAQAAQRADPARWLAIAAAVLLSLDVALLGIAMRRFQRARLILDE